MPAAGWPTVIYGHGTGGYHGGFADGSMVGGVAGALAREGLVGIGLSLPFHGERGDGSDPTLASFNYLNIASGRCTFRQAALEQIYLIEILARSSQQFRAGDTGSFQTDPERIAYMGHSHGGEVGALAAPFLGGRLSGMVLSGAGGGVSLSLVHRDAGDIDIQGLVQSFFDFEEGEALVETHPLVGMVQMLTEVSDPLNQARHWHRDAPPWAATPLDVLHFEGRQDIHTPPAATEALAAAAHQPILAPEAHRSTAHDLLDLPEVEAPLQGNLVAWDGSRVTGALAQFEDRDHFAIFDDGDAQQLYAHFLATALAGSAEIGEQ
jgi:pimeloyl-ACP methyl ester carboxylesterase